MDTFDDLLQRIQRRRKRLGISKHLAWYRGHRMNHYKLVPSVLRYKTGSRHERNIYARFGTEGAELLNASMSSWERLAIMQHHGVPTRLLDWTGSIHAALFFATLYDLTLMWGGRAYGS